MHNDFWNGIDKIIELHNEQILSESERQLIAQEEQKAFESNAPIIEAITNEFEQELKSRGFWTEFYMAKNGFKFRFTKHGYYGPGGFSSQFHIAGPLVLGIIDPPGDPHASYYKNTLEENIQIGCNFSKSDFINFFENVIKDYLSPKNLVISKEQYDYLRKFKTDS